MAKDEAKGADAERRHASILLSGLVMAPDSALDVFRKRRAENPDLDIEQLRRARDILEELHRAITGGDAATWTRVDEAWRLLCERGEPAAADAEPPDADRADGRPPAGPRDEESHSATLPAETEPAAAPAIEPPAVEAPAIEAPPPAPPPPLAAKPSPGPASPWAAPRRTAPQFKHLMDVPIDELDNRTLPAEGLAAAAPLPFKAGAFVPPAPAAEAPRERRFTAQMSAADARAARPLPFEEVPESIEAELVDDGSSAEQTESPGAMAIEHYAALCAECAAYPQWVPQVHARYGIKSGAERAALDESWRKRMKADPDLEKAFRWHRDRWAEWAKNQRR